jgi:hypothetical protein
MGHRSVFLPNPRNGPGWSVGAPRLPLGAYSLVLATGPPSGLLLPFREETLTPLRIALLVIVGMGLSALTLFVVQNSARTVELTFDLYFGAWSLQQPANLMGLLGIVLATGLILGLIVGGLFRRGSSAQPALGASRSADEWT